MSTSVSGLLSGLDWGIGGCRGLGGRDVVAACRQRTGGSGLARAVGRIRIEHHRRAAARAAIGAQQLAVREHLADDMGGDAGEVAEQAEVALAELLVAA